MIIRCADTEFLVKKIADVDPINSSIEEWSNVDWAFYYMFSHGSGLIPEAFEELSYKQKLNFIQHYNDFSGTPLYMGWLTEYDRIKEEINISRPNWLEQIKVLFFTALTSSSIMALAFSFALKIAIPLAILLTVGSYYLILFMNKVNFFMKSVNKFLASIKRQNDCIIYKINEAKPEFKANLNDEELEDRLIKAGWLKEADLSNEY